MPLLAALVRVLPKAAGAKIPRADPRLHRLVEVIPQRTALDAKPEVEGLDALQRVQARDLHGGGADVEGAELGLVAEPLSDVERDGGRRGKRGGRDDRAD